MTLRRFPKWEDFQSFQQNRASDGCEQWLPIITQCVDGTLVREICFPFLLFNLTKENHIFECQVVPTLNQLQV